MLHNLRKILNKKCPYKCDIEDIMWDVEDFIKDNKIDGWSRLEDILLKIIETDFTYENDREEEDDND